MSLLNNKAENLGTQACLDALDSKLNNSTGTHKMVLAAAATTVGGAAAEVITVSGALTTDLVHATLAVKGSTPRTILTAKITSVNTLTVTFSGDPSTDHVIHYSLIRAIT